MSLKTERIANMLVREISDILQNEVYDRDIRFVTITAIKVDTDLSLAQVYCTMFNKENKYVGLDERIEYIINKVPDGNPEIIERILLKKQETKDVLDKIAQIIGKSIDELFI